MQTHYVHPVPIYTTDIGMPVGFIDMNKNMIDIRLVKFMVLMQYIGSNLYVYRWRVLYLVCLECAHIAHQL